jgi:hypothetical protein
LQELDHPVFCVDEHPDGRFVECLPDSIQNFGHRCSNDRPLPYPRLTNTTIPLIGVLYKQLPEDDAASVMVQSAPGGRTLGGQFVAGQNAERRKKAQAVLARHRGDGVMCNQTLKTAVRPEVKALMAGMLSTDKTSFRVGLWSVDMVDYPVHRSQATAQVPWKKQSREPPLVIIALLCLGSVVGDLLGQRATRHHFKSTRR